MRASLATLSFAAVIGLVCCQSAAAFPAGAAAIKVAAPAAPMAQPAQYTERRTRHGIVKCYREFVFGRYVCHRYRNW